MSDHPEAAAAGRLSYAIFLLARAHRGYAAQLLRELGLHPGQEHLLMQLYDRDGQTQSELLASVGLDHSTVSKAISRMEQAGLLVRERSPQDRRVVQVFLTDAGRAMREPIERMWATLEATTTGALTRKEAKAFVASAEAIQRAIDMR